VVATPHIGAQTVEAQQRAANDIATEIVRALRGEELRWRCLIGGMRMIEKLQQLKELLA
jgi:phosphoglycerate dehydrogenase-like enzyme